MKLAFCLFNYFPFGGLQKDFLRIAKECVSRGHTVDVYTMKWEGERDPALAIHILPVKGWQNHRRIRHFVAQFALAKTKKDYDLVVGFNKMPGLDVYYAADTCYSAKTREKHAFWYQLTPRYRQLLQNEKAVFASDAKTQVLLIARKQQKEFQHFYQTADERFHLLPPGISKAFVAPHNAQEIRSRVRSEWRLTNDDLLLLMVGSGFKTKGLDRCIKGIAALAAELKQRIKFLVIGRDHEKKFQKMAVALGVADRIQFLGGRMDVPQFLLAADLLLHPAYNENTGTVLLEAVASGLPVLTTDVCGYAEYITRACAGLVMASPFNQIEFNQLLGKMLLSKERASWSKNGLAFAKTADIYDLPTAAATIIERVKSDILSST